MNGASAFSSIGPGAPHLTINAGQIISSRKQRPFLSNRDNGKTSSGHFTDLPPNEDRLNSPDPRRCDQGTNGSDERIVYVKDTHLEEEVRELSVKIAELTALMMAQQGGINEE
jgi:hypothetical protein